MKFLKYCQVFFYQGLAIDTCTVSGRFFIMENKKLFSYVLLTSLGFLAAVFVGLFMFIQFRDNMKNYSGFFHNTFEEQTQKLSVSMLGSTARYIEEMYPFLYDTEKLKLEAGSEWFWRISAEWRELADIYNLAYIYYLEKIGDNYIFLMSSVISPYENPELLGAQVWEDEIPGFFDYAWETGEMTISPELTVNEWGTLISVARPILSGGRTAGILGISYDVAFLNKYVQDELLIEEEEAALLLRMQIILIISTIIIITFMGYQIWLSTNFVIVPLRQLEVDGRTKVMLDATPMLCTLWDINGNLLDCNDEIMRVIGISSKSEYINNYFKITPETQPDGENSRDAAKRHIKETLETGYSRFNWTNRTLAGEDIPMETTVVRVPWEDSYRIAAYSRDLRETIAKDAALRESEERMQVMFDSMTLACYHFDQDKNIIDCNQRAVALFGCSSKKEFIEKFELLSPEFQPDGVRSAEKKRELLNNIFNTERNIFSWQHIKLDGTPLPVEITLMPVPWKNGFRIIAYARDLSKLFETEDNLIRVMSITESSPNFNLSLGPNGAIEYVNPAVSTITGVPREELFEKGLSVLFSPENFERLNREYFAAALENKSVTFELPLVTRNSGIRDFFFSAFSVPMRHGQMGIGLLGRDVTETKQLQRELTVAKEQAERSLASEVVYNRAKSNFLSRVSHELRTPLNAIIGVTNIAEKTGKKIEPEENYYKIKNASEHLLGLVNDILDMTGFETGEFEFKLAPFSLSKALLTVIESTKDKALKKKQTLLTDIDIGKYNRVIGDERRLRQVLQNLLNNALKFTPQNGVIHFNARVSDSSADQCRVTFEIIDDGIGMTREVLDRLGGILEQADSSITREYGGMGLGLSLTQKIVKLMKGSIWVDSELGKGTHFNCDVCFDVAQETAEQDAVNPVIPAARSESPVSINLKGRRVLIVDDVDINREILITLLGDKGAILDEAHDGDEAVRIFSQNKYDLVLMDLHMPNMDGFTAAKLIRSSPFTWAKNIPIISVSAENSRECHERCLEAGINDYITKPVETDVLFRIISKWMADKVF